MSFKSVGERFSNLNAWIKYGILNAFIGVFVGVHLALTAIGDGYYVFIFAVPLAIFLTGGMLWKVIVGTEKPTTGKVISLGILTGSISHYFTFLFLSILMNIGYWCFGICTDSLGEPPASILSMIGGSFLFSFFSLFMYGWITVPASVLAGFFMLRLMSKSAKRNNDILDNGL